MNRRPRVIALVLTALLVLAFFGALLVGSAGLTLPEVMRTLTGHGDPALNQVVLDWRLPRALFALLGGMALALSGAIFQFITRNPLGSPDIIGFSAGAYTGALLVSALGVSALWGRPVGALLGGLLAGAAVYFLAWEQGLSGFRIIIVGIAVSVFLSALNTYLLLTLQREQALIVAGWGLGSLANISWRHVVVLGIALLITLPLLFYLRADLRLLDLGDDTAAGLGVRVSRLRAVLLGLGIILVAAVTAAAGPIAFVALAAPQLAKRLASAPAIPLYMTAVVGALLLVTSDIAARLLIPGGQLPAGVITLSVGGLYLLWLLAQAGLPTGAARTERSLT
ncbi:FecCD family ABC transporter permease [Scrofimicrobium sp. R131]|uniref:Iron chelate uptake ABC transporter family permease subunit n=1 Tax=Scrofimicrobium appendicitidis TaxID=3079930 RepID=A0AAU7V897_9ACTO